jgi:hypothetical protein
MGLEENSVNGAGAMDEEERRQLEQGFLEKMPLLKWNPAALRQMVEAVAQGRASVLDLNGRLKNSNERPSDALDSQGRVVGSDLGQGTGYDMEAYRRQNMTGFPPEAEQRAQSFARIMATENSDEEHELSRNPRYFGQAGDGSSPGQRFVQKALADTNHMPTQAENDTFHGNDDPNDRGMQAGGKTVADDEVTPGGGPRGQGRPSSIRNIPAAGRFGLRRGR